MPKLVSSKYNYEFTGLDGDTLIMNGLSGTIIEHPHGGLRSPELSSDDTSLLVEHNFLHDADEGQEELLLRRNLAVKNNASRVEVTVQLHEECNFRCTYCNQDFRNQEFDDPLQARLMSYLNDNVPQNGKLYMHYYGGEPLLAWEQLVCLDQSIVAFAREKNVHYRFFITSNGSLLSQDKVDYLAERDVRHVKVTLDGPAEVHDARRLKAGGQATFELIVRNIVAAAPRIPIVVRVNIDGSNYARIPELVDYLNEELGAAGHTDTGPASVAFDFNIVYDGRTRRLAPDVSYEDLYRLQRYTLDAGFQLRLPPLLRFRHCKFNSPKSALIDTDGGIYVCDKTPELKAGELPALKVGEPPAPDRRGAEKKSLPVFKANPRDGFTTLGNDCKSCPVLPLCGGGCSLLAAGKEGPACPPWKPYLSQYLQIHHMAQSDSNPEGGGRE